MQIRSNQEYRELFADAELEILYEREKKYEHVLSYYPVTMWVLKPKLRDWEGWGQ